MEQKNIHPFGVKTIERVQNRPEVDYVLDDVLYRGGGAASVLVTSSSDLAGLTGYNPGTVAYTAGFANMWQLSAAGTWVEI